MLDEQAILLRILPEYELPKPIGCRFLTRGDSDIYQVETEAGLYYLKIRRPPISRERCDAEARLIVDLAAADVPVVRPVALKRGDYTTEVHAGEGVRAILVFESAPPALSGPLNVQQCAEFGQLLARLHEVSSRRHDDALPDADSQLLQKAAADVIAAVTLSADQQEILHNAVRYVADRYARLSRDTDDYGPVHGDLATSNLRISADGRLTLFDFGSSADGRLTLFDFGAAHRTWRLNELLNAWHRTLPRATPGESDLSWRALLDGYASVRAIPNHLDDFKEVTRLSAKIGMMGYICNALTLRLGVEPIEEHKIVKQVEEVREMLASLRGG